MHSSNSHIKLVELLQCSKIEMHLFHLVSICPRIPSLPNFRCLCRGLMAGSGILEDPTGRSKEDLFGSGKQIISNQLTEQMQTVDIQSTPSVHGTGEITWHALIDFLQPTFDTLFGFHVRGLYQARTKILEITDCNQERSDTVTRDFAPSSTPFLLRFAGCWTGTADSEELCRKRLLFLS